MSDQSRRALLLGMLALCLASTAAIASQVRPVNLEQMTQRAGRIFSGTCIEARTEETGSHGRVTVVTFAVREAVKGSMGETVTIKLPGTAGAAPGTGISGLPAFRPGEEVVLFLYGESTRGMSSPVGLGQGKFAVYEDKRGNRIATNALGNTNLFRDLSDDAKARLGAATVRQLKDRGGVDPEALLEMVQRLGRSASPLNSR